MVFIIQSLNAYHVTHIISSNSIDVSDSDLLDTFDIKWGKSFMLGLLIDLWFSMKLVVASFCLFEDFL